MIFPGGSSSHLQLFFRALADKRTASYAKQMRLADSSLGSELPPLELLRYAMGNPNGFPEDVMMRGFQETSALVELRMNLADIRVLFGESERFAYLFVDSIRDKSVAQPMHQDFVSFYLNDRQAHVVLNTSIAMHAWLNIPKRALVPGEFASVFAMLHGLMEDGSEYDVPFGRFGSMGSKGSMGSIGSIDLSVIDGNVELVSV